MALQQDKEGSSREPDIKTGPSNEQSKTVLKAEGSRTDRQLKTTPDSKQEKMGSGGHSLQQGQAASRLKLF